MLVDILHFIEFILVFALALIALVITLIIVVSKMPNGIRLKWFSQPGCTASEPQRG
jgi:ABC-type lipoprotein release transport system permease subunit